MNRTVEAVGLAASGVSVVSVGAGYAALAAAGAIIGICAWFYGMVHADPRWDVWESAGKALKYILFGLLVMPAVVDASSVKLSEYGIDMPSVRIMLGGIAAFVIVEIVTILLRKLRDIPVGKKTGGRDD